MGYQSSPLLFDVETGRLSWSEKALLVAASILVLAWAGLLGWAGIRFGGLMLRLLW